MITYIHGDLLNSECQYICHQVNCQGKMNSGVAKQIREKWPKVYQDYNKKCKNAFQNGLYSWQLLGNIQICALYDDYYETVRHQHVVNLFAQEYYGYDGKRYTSYDAFWTCLNELKRLTPEDATFAFPYKIGSDRGGANWNVILKMIEEVFVDRKVHIYYLNKNVLELNDSLNLED